MILRLFLLPFAVGAAMLAAGVAQAQDVAAGRVRFRQRCLMCHAITPGANGLAAPNLAGVAHRRAGSTAFAYSPAMRQSALIWDAPALNAFLASPGRVVPGTRMVVNVPAPKTRADLVAYLMTLE